jgi:hypothetical protein
MIEEAGGLEPSDVPGPTLAPHVGFFTVPASISLLFCCSSATARVWISTVQQAAYSTGSGVAERTCTRNH